MHDLSFPTERGGKNQYLEIVATCCGFLETRRQASFDIFSKEFFIFKGFRGVFFQPFDLRAGSSSRANIIVYVCLTRLDDKKRDDGICGNCGGDRSCDCYKLPLLELRVPPFLLLDAGSANRR